MSWGVGPETTALSAPIVIPPRDKFVRGRRGGKPRTNMLVEPDPLRMRVVQCQKRPESIWADITGDDEEIARGNVRQVSVEVAECNDAHVADWIRCGTETGRIVTLPNPSRTERSICRDGQWPC